MTGHDWEQRIYYTNASLAYTFNSLLIYLIVRYSRKSLGSYRLLMMSFAIFDIFYPTVHLVVFPQLHSYRHMFVFFPNGILKYNMFWGYAGICFYCACFCLSITLLAFHFVYRYLAVCRNHMLFIFDQNRYRILLVCIYLASGACWFSSCYFILYTDKEIKDYVSKNLMEVYGVDMEEVPVLGPLYFTEHNGTKVPYFRGIIGVGNCACILTASFTCMIYCACKIVYTLRTSTLMSEKTKRLQIELFRALCVQALIPAVLEYIPCGVCFLAPMIPISLSEYYNYILIALCSYPPIDPLCVIYFVKDYRNGFCKTFRIGKGRKVDDGSTTRQRSSNLNTVSGATSLNTEQAL